MKWEIKNMLGQKKEKKYFYKKSSLKCAKQNNIIVKWNSYYENPFVSKYVYMSVCMYFKPFPLRIWQTACITEHQLHVKP